MTIVQIQWIDSARLVGWRDADDIPDWGDLRTESVGILVAEDDDSVTISTTYHASLERFIDPLTIPRVAIEGYWGGRVFGKEKVMDNYHLMFPPSDGVPAIKGTRNHRKATKGRRRKVWIRNERKCYYCNRELELNETTVDHKQPRSKGGTNAIENTVAACRECNNAKGDKSESEFQSIMKV